MKTETKTVRVKNSTGEVVATDTYVSQFAETLEEARALEPSNANLLAYFNYGRDLKIKASIRAKISPKDLDKEKVFEQNAKAWVRWFASMGKTITIEQAKAELLAKKAEIEAEG